MSSWHTPLTLENEHVRLEPLASQHRSGLLIAAESIDTFQFMPLRPNPFSEAGISGYIEALRSKGPDVQPLCVIERSSAQPVGVTAFLDMQPQHRSLEIGFTWISPRCRGSAVNPSMKLLMLAHAFETLDAFRVCLKTDARNAQSRRAIEKLGGKLDGVLRSHIVLPDGHRRDSAYYSILDSEWSAARERLVTRLARLRRNEAPSSCPASEETRRGRVL